MGAIYRYWILPGCWRHRTVAGKSIGGFVLLAVALVGAMVPLLIWRPVRAWKGWDGFSALLYYSVFGLVVSAVVAVHASTSIASERNRGTWDHLRLAPIG